MSEPPRRLHADPKHADYDHFWCRWGEVFVDGVKQARIQACNLDDGWADQITFETDRIRVERLFGAITIAPRDDAPPPP